MNLRSISARAAGAGAVTALVAAGLVAATNTSAEAATADTTYTCTLPGPAGPVDVPLAMHIDVPLLPPTAPAGFPVDAGLLSFSAELAVPAAVASALGTIDGGRADDFTVAFGDGSVAAPVVFDTLVPNEDGSAAFTGSGSNDAFSLPKAGTYNVSMPASFNLIPTVGGSALPTSFPCVSDAPGSLGSVQLTKQISTMTATAKKIATGYKVTALVSNEYTSPTGKVTTKLGAKKYSGTINNGKAVLKLPKSAKGKTLTLKYAGDSYSQPTSTKVTPK